MQYEKTLTHLKSSLSSQKYNHTLNVANTAKSLAIKAGGDGEKAYFAGLLHDITKEFSHEKHLSFCSLHNLKLDFVEENEAKLLNSQAKQKATLSLSDSKKQHKKEPSESKQNNDDN